MSTPHASDLSLNHIPSEPLTLTAREARDAMLDPLRARLVVRRRRRIALRVTAACVLALAALVGTRALTTPTPTHTPDRETAHQPAHQPAPTPPVSPPAPTLTPAPPKKFAVTIITTDPSVLERLTAKPPATPIITMLSDDELLDALEAAGTPGLIKINGKVVLSRDLFKPADTDTKPQSLVPPADRTHG